MNEVWITTHHFTEVNKRECLIWVCNEANHVELAKYHPPFFIGNGGSPIPEILIKCVAHIITPQPPSNNTPNSKESSNTK